MIIVKRAGWGEGGGDLRGNKSVNTSFDAFRLNTLKGTIISLTEDILD